MFRGIPMHVNVLTHRYVFIMEISHIRRLWICYTSLDNSWTNKLIFLVLVKKKVLIFKYCILFAMFGTQMLIMHKCV